MWCTEKIVEKAFDNICHKRIDYHSNDDIWDLRHNWATEKHEILQDINNGSYKFNAVK